VVKAWGPLMLGAKISSSRTMGKSVTRLEQMGFFERNNEGRVADKPGAFVFRSAGGRGCKAVRGEGHASGDDEPRGKG
jgi:hypothetical protein